LGGGCLQRPELHRQEILLLPSSQSPATQRKQLQPILSSFHQPSIPDWGELHGVDRPELNSRGNGSRVAAVPATGPLWRSAMLPPKPANEQQRLATLRGYEILDTEPEAAFDDLTLLASCVCQTPIALISLVDADRQWFKSSVGFSVKETSRDIAFCASAILQSDVFIVPDASEDERFAENPLVVSEPKIRFYAGAPLVRDGHALGTLCVFDRVARKLSPEQLEALRALGRQVQAQLDLRRNLKRLAASLAARDRAEEEKDLVLRELKAAMANIRTLEGLLPICLSCKKIQDKKGDWQPFEYYVRAHSEAKVTHKLCPDCTKALSA